VAHTTSQEKGMSRTTSRTLTLAIAATLATAVSAQTAGTDTSRPGAPGAVPPTVANPTGGSPVPNVPLGSAQDPGPATAQPHSGSMRSARDENTIRQVQSQLKSAGHDPGPIDGQMSDTTGSALRSFQQARGLQATGQLDPQTLAALGIQDTSGGGGRSNTTATPQQPAPQGRQDSTSSRTGGASTTGGGSTTGSAPSNVPGPGTSGATGSNMSGTTETNSATRR
jgi:hypothetical protein